jgi:hypothetical protein
MVPLLSRNTIAWKGRGPFMRKAVTLSREPLPQSRQAYRSIGRLSEHMQRFADERSLTYHPIMPERLMINYFNFQWCAEHLLMDPSINMSERTAQEIYQQEILDKAGESPSRVGIAFNPGRIVVSCTAKKPGGRVVRMEFDGQDGYDLAQKLGSDHTTLRKPAVAVGTLWGADREPIQMPVEEISGELMESFQLPESTEILGDTYNTTLIFGRLLLGYSAKILPARTC